MFSKHPTGHMNEQSTHRDMKFLSSTHNGNISLYNVFHSKSNN
jgi:hypothetical protein